MSAGSTFMDTVLYSNTHRGGSGLILPNFNETETITADNIVIKINKRPLPTIDIELMKNISTKKIAALVGSALMFSIGILDILIFVTKNIYLFHPYFAIVLSLSGFFLLATFISTLKK